MDASDAPPFPEDLKDRYSPVRCLGAGGMGVVFQAVEEALGRHVAIKIIRAVSDPELRARFAREAKSMARIRHSNVVQIYSHGTSAQGPYIVMEDLQGIQLHKVQRRIDVLEVLMQAAAGLEAIHAVGLVHRDLKPQNILLTKEGRAVLIDLGLAADPDRTALTRVGVAVGTLGFIAPETIRGERYGPPADWFAWGVTLFALVEGRLPFDTADQLAASKGQPLPAPRFERLPPDHPLAGLLRRILDSDLPRRPTTVPELELALSGAGPGRTLGPAAEVAQVCPTETLTPDTLGQPGGSQAATLPGGASAAYPVARAPKGPAPSPRGEGAKRKRRRMLRFYLPIALSWLVAGCLGWWMFGPTAPTAPTAPAGLPTLGTANHDQLELRRQDDLLALQEAGARLMPIIVAFEQGAELERGSAAELMNRHPEELARSWQGFLRPLARWVRSEIATGGGPEVFDSAETYAVLRSTGIDPVRRFMSSIFGLTARTRRMTMERRLGSLLASARYLEDQDQLRQDVIYTANLHARELESVAQQSVGLAALRVYLLSAGDTRQSLEAITEVPALMARDPSAPGFVDLVDGVFRLLNPRSRLYEGDMDAWIQAVSAVQDVLATGRVPLPPLGRAVWLASLLSTTARFEVPSLMEPLVLGRTRQRLASTYAEATREGLGDTPGDVSQAQEFVGRTRGLIEVLQRSNAPSDSAGRATTFVGDFTEVSPRDASITILEELSAWIEDRTQSAR